MSNGFFVELKIIYIYSSYPVISNDEMFKSSKLINPKYSNSPPVREDKPTPIRLDNFELGHKSDMTEPQDHVRQSGISPRVLDGRDLKRTREGRKRREESLNL